MTGGARQAVESASAPLRARWLVVFRPVRRRPNRRQIGSESSGAVPLAALGLHGLGQTESVEKASSARGIVVCLVCPCSVDWLQKSAGGVGPRKPFSVVAEDGGKGLARSGEPATGERAPRPESSSSWRRDQRRARKSSPPMEGVVDRESRQPSTGSGGSDLDRTDEAPCALKPREQCPGGDATSEVSPLTASSGSKMAPRCGGTSWLKRAERR